MAQTLIAAENDEIADLINLVRSASDPDVGLVVPLGSTALQTPLNARLLSQFSKRTGRRTAIVSGDPRVQELARANGFRVYSSVPAYERGIEAFVTRTPGADAGNGAPPTGEPEMAAAVAASAASRPPLPPPLDSAPSPLAAPFAPPRPVTSVAPPQPPPTQTSLSPRRTTLAPRPTAPLSFFNRHRKKLYAGGGGLALLGLLLFLILAPSASIAVTLAGTPLSVNPTIQGGTDANAAKGGDHILTQVLTATGTGNFNASPTGQKTLPAAAATGTVTLSTNEPNLPPFSVPQGDTFQTTDHSITFVVTQTTNVCLGANGQPPPQSSSCTPNSTVPIQDATPEAKGNVAANAITYWPQNPCSDPTNCTFFKQTYQINVTNPQPTTGGADAKQQTTASSSDVSNWQNQVTQIENNLTSQVNSQLQGQAAGRTFAVDPSGGGKSLTFDVKPSLPSADQQFATTGITITANAKAVVYTPKDPQNNMLSDIKAQVSQGDQLGPNSFKPGACQVTQADVDGTVILSCAATGFSQPVVDLHSLRSQLAGKNPGDANKIIQSKVDKVQDVEVSEFPFKWFYLPLNASRIKITENFVSQPPR